MAKHKDKTPDKSKSKKENKEEEVENNGVGETESKDVRPDYDILKHRVNVISNPLASRKLTSKLYKTVKKASKVKCLRRGVKEVVKALRKGETGFVVIAGDISPIDVISHVPVTCEDNSVPYVYVPSKVDLGAASGTKRPTCIVMVKQHEDIKEHYDKCRSAVMELPLPI